jgi:hypothetical protein
MCPSRQIPVYTLSVLVQSGSLVGSLISSRRSLSLLSDLSKLLNVIEIRRGSKVGQI